MTRKHIKPKIMFLKIEIHFLFQYRCTTSYFARPKSQILTLPPPVNNTFSGFKSRWMMALPSYPWRYWSPSSSSRNQWNICGRLTNADSSAFRIWSHFLKSYFQFFFVSKFKYFARDWLDSSYCDAAAGGAASSFREHVKMVKGTWLYDGLRNPQKYLQREGKKILCKNFFRPKIFG